MSDPGSDLGLFSGLGRALQFLRMERGLTQPALSEATRRLGRGRGVGKTSISGYERGHSIPTLGVLSKLLEAMEVDLAKFVEVLDRIGDPSPAARPTVRRPSGAGGGQGDGAAPRLPAYLVVDLGGAASTGPPATATTQQLVDLIALARGLVEEGRVPGCEEAQQPAAGGGNAGEEGEE